MNTASDKNESGSTLILVMTVMTIVIVAVAVALDFSTNINRHVQRSNTLGNAIAIGDGCIDHLFAYWRNKCRPTQQGGGGVSIPTTSDLTALPSPTAAEFAPSPYPSPFSVTPNDFSNTAATTVQQCKVIAVDPELAPMPTNAATPKPSSGQDPGTVTYNYLATAFVTLPTMKGNTANSGAVVAKVQRVLQKQQISPWNYAIFYIDPLEMHPGVTQNINGWVHTNSNLYTATSNLHYLDKVTYGGSWSIGWQPGDPRSPNNPAPQSPSWVIPPATDQQHDPFGIDSGSVFSTTDSNPNNDGYHELIDLPNKSNDPSTGQPWADPLAGMRYSDQAGITILVDASNNVTIKKQNGTILNSSSAGNDLALYNMFNGALTTNQTMFDARQGAQVRLVTLDVGKLINSNGNWGQPGSTTNVTFNGILYINDTSASSSTQRGVRLKKGSYVPSSGFTVASGNPVYIQGDYNTGYTSGGGSPGSNSGTPTQPDAYTTSGGPARAPCAVLGDAVYVLSNNWNDSQAGSGLSSRIAANTTVNTAIVSGIVPTNYNNNGAYSGGAENFPRFLEDWSSNGNSLTYYGSMVELFASQQATAKWQNTGIFYNAPVRQWYFDTKFRLRPPPGSLMIYNYIKGRWALVSP